MRALLQRRRAMLFLAGLFILVGVTPLTAGDPTPVAFDPKSLPQGLSSITVTGVPVVYSDQGKGDPLIVLTPYPFSTSLWTELTKLLTGSLRVIVVEPPGLRDPSSMKGDFYSHHLLYIYRDFVKTLGLTNVHIMGVGEAGALAVAFGHHFPEITGAVVSINGFESVNWSDKVEGMVSLFKQTTESGLTMLLTSGSVRYRDKPPSHEEMGRLFPLLGDDTQRTGAQARFKAYTSDLQEAYVLAMLPNFDRPVLLLRSEEDQLLADAEKFYQRTRTQIRKVPIRLQLIPKAGHFAFLDQPANVAEQIRTFLSENRISK